MPYVVTQSCCADASCVVACPVNCIHPTPGEPGFAEAEMLYIDANSCVDCGACVTACPVDAIAPHTKLTPSQQPFLQLNADYYDVFPHPDRAPLAIVSKQRRLARAGPVRIAVVGAGPAGLYTADELLKHPEIEVDVYDRLPTPYGLVRAGVAPDHQRTKQVQKLFRAIEEQPGFRYFLGVEVGRDLTLADLSEHYHGVVYAVGAASDRPLDIPGVDLPGSSCATDFVGWYNGHPDKQHLDVPLDHERVVVVGNGNVALDVARILTGDRAALARTDLADAALEALRGSPVREVVLLGRRGPVESAFTVPELVGLAGIEDLNIEVEAPEGLGLGDDDRTRLLRELAERPPRPGCPSIVFRFLSSPVEILGEERVTGVRVVRNRLETDADGRTRPVPTGETETIEAGLVLRSIGYRGEPVADLPYDERTGVVPHDRGRVRPGVYVAGWAKRGPSGFIGTNKSCSQETVDRVLDDLDAAAVHDPAGPADAISTLVRDRQPNLVDLAGWQAIDAEERRRGLADHRPRVKLVEVGEMTRVAHRETVGVGRGRYAASRVRRDKRR